MSSALVVAAGYGGGDNHRGAQIDRAVTSRGAGCCVAMVTANGPGRPLREYVRPSATSGLEILLNFICAILSLFLLLSSRSLFYRFVAAAQEKSRNGQCGWREKTMVTNGCTTRKVCDRGDRVFRGKTMRRENARRARKTRRETRVSNRREVIDGRRRNAP